MPTSNESLGLVKLRWELSVWLSRWRHRLQYFFKAPSVYRNWWAMPLPELGWSTVLELRNGTRYFVRTGTLDLAVINEAALLDPYLGPGFLVLRPDSVILDIGANIGDFAIQAAKRCPNGRIIAIEPLSYAGQMIDTQARLNGIHNVTWIRAAVSASEGETTSDLVGGAYQAKGEAEQVRVMTLPQIVRELGLTRIDLVKLDCEGAEWDILPASDEVLPMIQQICMEFHCERDWTPARLSTWLRVRGFDVTHTGGSWNGLLWARKGGLAGCRRLLTVESRESTVEGRKTRSRVDSRKST